MADERLKQVYEDILKNTPDKYTDQQTTLTQETKKPSNVFKYLIGILILVIIVYIGTKMYTKSPKITKKQQQRVNQQLIQDLLNSQTNKKDDDTEEERSESDDEDELENDDPLFQPL